MALRFPVHQTDCSFKTGTIKGWKGAVYGLGMSHLVCEDRGFEISEICRWRHSVTDAGVGVESRRECVGQLFDALTEYLRQVNLQE